MIYFTRYTRVLWMVLDIEAFTPGMDSMHTHTALDMDAMDGYLDGMDAMDGWMRWMDAWMEWMQWMDTWMDST